MIKQVVFRAPDANISENICLSGTKSKTKKYYHHKKPTSIAKEAIRSPLSFRVTRSRAKTGRSKPQVAEHFINLDSSEEGVKDKLP